MKSNTQMNFDIPAGATHFQEAKFYGLEKGFEFFKLEFRPSSFEGDPDIAELYYWVKHKNIWLRDHDTSLKNIRPIEGYLMELIMERDEFRDKFEQSEKQRERLELELQKYKFAISEINELIENSNGIHDLNGFDNRIVNWDRILGQSGYLTVVNELIPECVQPLFMNKKAK